MSVARERLVSQRIDGSPSTDPAEVVRWMLALQAQDYASAKWAVGLRAPGCTERDVEAAVASGALVRSWPMRGTLHLTAAEDLGWLLALTKDRMVSSTEARRRGIGLDAKLLGLAERIAQRELEKPKSRAAFLEDLARGGFDPTNQRGYHALFYLAQTGMICLGPPEGKQQTFVLLDSWVKRPRALEHDEALGELARRYVQGHGPARTHDLAAWSKLPLGLVRRGIEVAKLGEDDGLLRGDERAASAGGTAFLLPAFDEYLLGYRDRSEILDARYSNLVVPGGNGIFKPMLVWDGQVVGTWKRTRRSLELTPFASLSAAARRAFQQPARHWCAFAEGPQLEVIWSAGPSQ